MWRGEVLDCGHEFSLLPLILFPACWDSFLLSPLALHFSCESLPVYVKDLLRYSVSVQSKPTPVKYVDMVFVVFLVKIVVSWPFLKGFILHVYFLPTKVFLTFLKNYFFTLYSYNIYIILTKFGALHIWVSSKYILCFKNSVLCSYN